MEHKYFKWLCLLLMLLSIKNVQAGDIYQSDIKFASAYTAEGIYEITIPIYDDNYNDEGLHFSGDSKISISADGLKERDICYMYSFNGYGDPQGDASWYWVKIKRTDFCRIEAMGNGSANHRTEIPKDQWYQINSDKNGTKTLVKFYIYVPAEYLQKEVTFKVHLHIDVNNASNYDINAPSPSVSALNFPDPALSNVANSTTEKGKQNITVNIPGQYNGDAYISATGYDYEKKTSRNFSYSVGDKSQTKTASVEYRLPYGRTVKKTSNFKINQYPRVSKFKATSGKKGSTNLEWEILDSDNPMETGGFSLKKKIGESGNFEPYKDFDNTTRSFLDEATINTPTKISYQICRKEPWTDFNPIDCSIAKDSLKHTKIKEFTKAELKSQRTVVLTWEWDYDSLSVTTVLTEGSKFIIQREVSTDGKNFIPDTDGTKELDCKDYKSKTCSETVLIPQSCVLYRWNITIKPGNDAYKKEKVVYPSKYYIYEKDKKTGKPTGKQIEYKDGINDTEVASLEYFHSSHGYYGDRVELDWKLDENAGSLDIFSVQRREYGITDTIANPFIQIGTVNTSDGIIHYSYTDTKAVPGTTYEYLIQGSKECANEEVKTKNYSYGFCTPTGNIYGRITFDSENGQAVEDAEVYLETTSEIFGKSFHLDGKHHLAINDSKFLDTVTDSLSFQLFAKFDIPTNTTLRQSLLQKPSMYELYAQNNYLYFNVGNQTLTSTKTISNLTKASSFIQITAVCSKELLGLYVNGENIGKIARTAGKQIASNKTFTMGKGFIGYLSEVRVWDKPLDENEVKKTFDRYLAGDEDGLIGYWTFNYATSKEFYDFAHKNSSFYMHDGKILDEQNVPIENAILSSEAENNPSPNQLGYKDFTDVDGSYYITGIPYLGNGTLYSIMPKLDSHKFSPAKTQVTLSSGNVNHSANFVDKSSFPVSGTITYKGGTIPVEGVQFYIDGKVCSDSKGNIITTDTKGKFTISVPVGTHEVKASMANHTFGNGGKLLDDYGKDINYQDDRYSTVKITDLTTVRYIGRVAGGTAQEALKVGHSLSKNNLAEGISIQLTYENAAYKLNSSNEESNISVEHFLPGNWKAEGKVPNTNNIRIRGNIVTISPNEETGEFIADLLPISYAVKVNVPGYTNISGNNSKLNLSDAFVSQYEINEYIDSVLDKKQLIKTAYNDTVTYNKKQQFIARVKPIINVVQVNGIDPLPYFGDETTPFLGLDGTKTVNLYDEKEGKYTLGLPLFSQANTYKLKASVYEEYPFYTASGDVNKDRKTDKVPSEDATLSFQTTMRNSNDFEDVEADSTGVAYWTFKAAKVDLTTANANINIKATVGDSGNATSIAWTSPFNKNNLVYTMGTITKGNNFITAGPDKILAVLRDPPGSNSYSYLEKGSTFTESSNYTGGVTQEGNEEIELNVGTELVTFTGVGVGVINSAVTNNQGTVTVNHSEEVTGSKTKTSSTTININYSTSEDEDYVGAMGDVFIGYSTNLSYGTADAITLVKKDKYEANISAYPTIYNDENSEYILAQTTSLDVGTQFATMFSYSQLYIKDYLLPEMESLRNSFLHQPEEMSTARFQAEANTTGKPIYVSYLATDDDNYGKSNLDSIFKDNPKFYSDDNKDLFDGPSYKIYFPNEIEQKNDTIFSLNQSMDAWIERLKENEKAKVDAIEKGTVLQNYSLQAGASIEYSKGYSNVKNSTTTFSILIGAGVGTENEFKILGSGCKLNISENLSTTQGGEFSSEEEATNNVGFVLADSGNDYFSVDVYQETGGQNEDAGFDDINSKDLNLSTFIFRTRAGATSCPYEDEEVTEYYQPGTVISEKTLQIEMPEIAVENAFIDNVPSGEPAYVTLYLRNNSALNEDGWFNLIVDDQANQLGAGLKMDGGAIGNGRTILVPAGETLTKVLEVTKGPGLNYDNLQLVLASQCQGDPTANFPAIADTVTFSVHFTPSCSDVAIKSPSNNWTYNTDLPTELNKAGIEVHYMDVKISDFNVNYDNFKSLKLMYKPSSNSDDNWITLMNYFNDKDYYNEAIKNGQNAEMIKSEDKGTISYKWFLDDMPDQNYDLCAVTVCNINNVDVENFSPTYSGVKDMYRPRLFGTPQPSNGILTINDDAKITFNESIAAGYLTENNFQVTGIKNGTATNHSVAVEVDGTDTFVSELKRSFRGKDITFEAWIKLSEDQDATFFKHGKEDESLSFGITALRQLTATVNGKVYTSEMIDTNDFLNNWTHVAMVLDQNEDGASTGKMTLYCNYKAYLEITGVPAYTQSATYELANQLKGQIHNIRIWTEARSSGQIQTQSNLLLSGNEENLLSYYPMDEAIGSVLKDKARGLNLAMTGGTWILPEGRGIVFNGTNSYLKINSGSSIVLDSDNDYTIELWFKGDNGNSDATLLANGKADGTDLGGSENLFFLGFENSVLTYRNNGQTLTATGKYLDNNWHHVAIAVNRMTSRIQMYVDGTLNAYADAADYGKIGSAYIFTGVTPNAIDNFTTSYINYFNGSIDDVRFWNLYKNETSVKEGMTSKLDGKEMGLLAYYPFEKHTVTSQNIPVVRFSLEDTKVPAATATQTPDATAVIGNIEFPSISDANRLTIEDAFMTSAIAPVKDKGGVVDLLFDFVVNNDALIVTLKEDAAKIEKTTVNFTVSDIRDLNGNSISSPITWTAYIDRNQLKWGEDEINLAKNVDDPLTFAIDAVNKGGYTEDYTISNFPSWMDIEPVTGTLTATKSQSIKFTINESVNIGTYNETIYLTNSEGVSEPLNITLKVNGKKPDWNVNPADYKFNMNVYGKIKINEKYSNDTEDILAAFVNDTCVGIANNQYIKVNDTYYTLLTIYSNVASRDSLDFKIWDASTGTTYVAMPEKKISFKANSIIGTPVNPIVFSNLDLVQLDIALDNGWTWTSFNVTNNNMKDLSTVLKNNKWLTGDEVKREDGGFATYGTGAGWVTDSLHSLKSDGMYMIRSSYTQTLSVIGTPVDVTQNVLTINSVNKDGVAIWNYLPYLAQNNLTINEALAGYEANVGDVIKSQSGFAMYQNNLGWIGSLTYMQPGRGYMLQRVGTKPATLQYPSAATQANKAGIATRAAETEDMKDLGYANTNYSRTMSMVATVDGIEVFEGDMLKTYVNGELRGESPIICNGKNGESLFFISIAGDVPENIDAVIERDEKVIAVSSDIATFKANEVAGTFGQPVIIDFTSDNSMAVYPSPFISELFIHKQVTENADVDVTITDAKGAIVAIFENCNDNGTVNIHWTDAANCTPGVYLVNIQVDSENYTYKATKIKL